MHNGHEELTDVLEGQARMHHHPVSPKPFVTPSERAAIGEEVIHELVGLLLLHLLFFRSPLRLLHGMCLLEFRHFLALYQ